MKKKTYNNDSTKKSKNKVVKKISKIAQKTKNEVGVEVKKLKQKYKKSTLSQKILILFMIGITSLLILFLLFALFIIISAPNFKASNLYSKNSTVIFDINGNEAARLGTENREIVTYEDLPEVLVDAIIATEDSRFFQHDGIDLARFSKAVFGQLLGHSDAGGGSTLTMQVAKKAFTSSVDTGIKGIVRKFTDIYLAVFKVEKNYTKEQIIEFYINNHNLGGAWGVEEASKYYFGKSAKDMNLAELAPDDTFDSSSDKTWAINDTEEREVWKLKAQQVQTQANATNKPSVGTGKVWKKKQVDTSGMDFTDILKKGMAERGIEKIQ